MANPTPGLEQTHPLVASISTQHFVTAAVRQPRVLACVLCQQRKVKCDRQFPCAHCLRAGVPCVPAALVPRQRRRRFPERDLLERLRHYEDLLRQNNVNFQPLHPTSGADANVASAEHASPTNIGASTTSQGRNSIASNSLDETQSEISYRDNAPVKSDSKPVDEDDEDSADTESKSGDHGDGKHNAQQVKYNVDASNTKNAWDRDDTYQSEQAFDKGHLLFGSPKTNVYLSTMHPEQVQILRLWQIYLENINPLLKVTHTPTLQARIITALSDLASISPTFEALMFSIYCVAIMSLTDQECYSLFSTSRSDLLADYQFASVAVRIAQRLGVGEESTYHNCTALEAEMRRRLWWSLVTFDHRLCEMSDYKTTALIPTWDCKTPLNVNDFELRPETKSSPPSHDRPTEALFAVVRSELADFVRHSAFHINFVNPSLNAVAKPKHDASSEGEELTLLENIIENRYLKFCDPDNPLHFMTIWTTRAYLARNRLLEHYSRFSTSSAQQTDAQRSAAVSHALSMLECETRFRTSPLTKGFIWHVDSNVPALAYIHILNGLKKRPDGEHADRAWEIMSDNYEARATHSKSDDYGISDVFSRVVLQVWAAREALCKEEGKPIRPPRIVLMFRDMANAAHQASEPSDPGQPDPGPISIGTGGSQLPMPFHFDDRGPGPHFFPGSELDGYPEIPGQHMMDVDVAQFLNPVDWRWM
ncbi:hypothetical protein Daus18300_011934 [Diaporthe australafricana]|uniref:Zn(2)-C6 fungal-type domain-containing protein n=1 Tax=Diaporthe australafricana TaxID=127596 RepID=A0ABR3W4J1_9PEZI